MKYLVLCFTCNFLFFISTVHSVSIDGHSNSLQFEFNRNFKIHCNVSTDSKNVTLKWLKNGEELMNIPGLKERIKIKSENGVNTLEVNRVTEKDAGNYTCLVPDQDSVRAEIQVTSKNFVKVPTNINVVEGEKLRIHCQVAGKPPPKLSWMFIPDSSNSSAENRTLIDDDDRIDLKEDEDHIPNSILTVTGITMDDRGEYVCIGTPVSGKQVKAKSMVRVKDKYAALWPFLGIVAEVVVLCAIIFIYEKKHNKAELDESDTDQSPDQKNTPDHGKDSNLRHRQ
ncbi:unnamed protein product [Brassicogethes aeneus]|uniref:Ig-like domain-containing protein n=1 Tax=Brassicogethes aeneus TaxID=1431903 RepID=A0A9P0FC93_BRAAE|nr:unnamed protein product [Brassicogethes aeneus]